jgi:hypothetical protein
LSCLFKEDKNIEVERKDMKKTERYEPTREDIIDLIHRMTGFNEDTIVEYFRVFKIKNPGKLTMDKVIGNLETMYFIERGLKIKKLMKKK